MVNDGYIYIYIYYWLVNIEMLVNISLEMLLL